MKFKEIKEYIALFVRKEKNNWDKNKITKQVGSLYKY